MVCLRTISWRPLDLVAPFGTLFGTLWHCLALFWGGCRGHLETPNVPREIHCPPAEDIAPHPPKVTSDE